MGTKVEAKIFSPGYFDMADSSVNSNCNVLRYHVESKPSGHRSDRFTIISANGSVHYNKEMLKRTMLVHEATFRKQVYELHRLYKIQKDLMAQFQREEFNGYLRYADTLQQRSYASNAPSGDVQRVWQIETPISGHDLKQSSIDFMNESSSQYSVNVAPLWHNNVRPRKKMLDLQLPADVYADDDVEILDEKPLKSFPGTNGSVLGGSVINLGNSESSHVQKSWITDIQLQHDSSMDKLNKPVEESSNMKITDFLGVRISTSQNQHVSQGVNLNLLGLQGNLREKCVGKVSDSSFIGANEEIKHSNSRQRKDDPNASMAWLQHKQSGTDSSMGHYLSSARSFNHLILSPPLFSDALNSPWQHNYTNYLTKSCNGTVETSIAKNALSNGILMDSPFQKIRGEPQYQKLPPLPEYLKDINLNDAQADNTATWEQESENSVVDISWVRKKLVNLMKSQVPSSCANGHSQTLVSSTSYSEDRTPTRFPGFPISAAAEKDSRCSPTLHCDISIAPLIKHEADMEMQPQSKNADTTIRNLIDLNEALPIMDDPKMDIRESEGDIVPHEPDDPLRDSLAITAAESLVGMCNDVVQPGSPQLDTLHWFADLATSKENTMFDIDSDDDFEALTLKLQETKSFEFHSTPKTQEVNSNDGQCSAALLLVTRPRRGKARGRPQKKNFRKGVLPGLASLPKHVVSEDLHTLGRSKPVIPAKRGGRNVRQPRGRRRARSVAVTMEEAEVSPPPVPPPLVPADLDADGLGITKWGRTTRRCRRPRCPPANNASLRVA
ncbi:uncharacterized protein LOC133905269 [Phragmites australis]|uniref:uncharacterized protein LOC133905269 n=1 Tax=Phragmites australis TaxID=29695 RepID=UPI002D790BA0|nr:uncharacterized protein LOC133905269 [Phragmites australis]XP_062202998.1 uncharacterized protein LOC133905269 [Phragmites australis]XP_062202999.1 uncharacterized protein LOC133905269 [Phragmites australis]XP_062203000.1 uncharacterized protein LOC133905269 [Phragmites australis]